MKCNEFCTMTRVASTVDSLLRIHSTLVRDGMPLSYASIQLAVVNEQEKAAQKRTDKLAKKDDVSEPQNAPAAPSMKMEVVSGFSSRRDGDGPEHKAAAGSAKRSSSAKKLEGHPVGGSPMEASGVVRSYRAYRSSSQEHRSSASKKDQKVAVDQKSRGVKSGDKVRPRSQKASDRNPDGFGPEHKSETGRVPNSPLGSHRSVDSRWSGIF